MKKNSGFTALDLLITLLIIGVIVLIAIMPLLSFISKNKLKHNSIAASQVIQEAQNYARTKSKYVRVVFTQSSVMVPSSTSYYTKYDFENNIFYSLSGTTVPNGIIYFNFKGMPVGITSSTNKIRICYGASSCQSYKTLVIAPVTGVVTVE